MVSIRVYVLYVCISCCVCSVLRNSSVVLFVIFRGWYGVCICISVVCVCVCVCAACAACFLCVMGVVLSCVFYGYVGCSRGYVSACRWCVRMACRFYLRACCACVFVWYL